MKDTGQPEITDLPKKLQWLFENMPTGIEGQDRHSSATLAQRVTELGVPVSAAYVRYLRTGERRNPSAVLLHTIARVFGVPVDYFHDDAVTVQVESDFARLLRMRQVGIDNVMFRAVEELPPDRLDQVIRMIERHLQEDPDGGETG